jgi:hypothetical protein
MKLTNENILLASLLGSQVVKALPRFAAVQNEMAKHVLPPVPFLPLRNTEEFRKEEQWPEHELWQNDEPLPEDRQFFPLSLRESPTPIDDEGNEQPFYLLPWEPLINISGRNIIAKRHVAKSGSKLIGSIKERITTDDFDITITGALYGTKERGNNAETYPREDMERLRDFLLSAKRLEVRCEALQILGINYIVVEEMNFPFTKGENVQAYEIKAVSDFDWNLIYKKVRPVITTGELKEIDWYE